MKKIFKKMYKILMTFGILIVNIRNRVFGVVDPKPYTAYGVDYMPTPDYGVEYIPKIDCIKIVSFIAIPIFWIIGIIVYWKKSKEEKKEKIKVLIIVNIIIIVLILIAIAVFKIIG